MAQNLPKVKLLAPAQPQPDSWGPRLRKQESYATNPRHVHVAAGF